MASLRCPFPECTFRTEELDAAGAAISLQIHGYTHAAPVLAPTPAPAPTTRGPKLDRPRIDTNATGEQWNAFIRRWETFKSGSNISDAAATTQLFECT